MTTPQQRHERILEQRDLEVRIQTPEGDNLAAEFGYDQVTVSNPDGSVVTFCGPVTRASLEDAALFAAAPHLYAALVRAYKVLQGDSSTEAEVARLEVETAIGQALGDFPTNLADGIW